MTKDTIQLTLTLEELADVVIAISGAITLSMKMMIFGIMARDVGAPWVTELDRFVLEVVFEQVDKSLREQLAREIERKAQALGVFSGMKMTDKLKLSPDDAGKFTDDKEGDARG